MAAKTPKIAGVFLGPTASRPVKGSTNIPRNTALPTTRHGPQRRAKMKPVSSGRLPYQITRNWAHIR